MLPYGNKNKLPKLVIKQAVLKIYFLDRGEYVLNIVVHLPNEEKQKVFQKNIIEIQSATIISKLNELKISTNDKKKILKELKDNNY